MKVEVKIAGPLYAEMRRDLARPHPFAVERVGFAGGRIGSLSGNSKLILLNRYHAIPDDQYVDDPDVGARIGGEALTWAMQAAYHGRCSREGVFHIHLHEHHGETHMSRTDARETPRMIPGFRSVGPAAAHGIVILSRDHGSAWIWLPGCEESIPAARVSVIGAPIGVFGRGRSR